MATMNDRNVNARLNRGEVVVVGKKMMAKCRACRKIIQVNKPVLGSMHICPLANLP